MAKIKNDKYYTSKELSEYVVNKAREVIGDENISEYLDPSAGGGAFLDFLDKPFIAYDIDPHDDRIEKKDYLTTELLYRKGRVIITNPPFGDKNTLSVQFFKKSIQLGDYIALILPISQLDNNQQMYEFTLIHSEDLGIREYSDRKVHCCFNIYERPENGEFNKKPSYKLKDVEIVEYRQGKARKELENYDIRIRAWGGDTKPDGKSLIGKVVDYPNQYAKEFGIKVHNEALRDKVVELIKNTNWLTVYHMTATPNLLQWQVYKYIKEQIPEIN